MNKQGGELETFLLKNNTSVPKLLEMERTIAETKQEEIAKNAFSAYDIQKQDSGKVPPITSYGECTHPNRKCHHRNNGKCTGKGFLIDLCKNLSEKELNESQETQKEVYEAIRDMGKIKKNNKTMNMKQITVINGNIVREGGSFFKAVQCKPRNPKARCENCAFYDCSNLEFSDPVFCNALQRLDNTNIVWRPMTREETLNEIQKRKNSVAEYQKLLESAKKAGEEAKYADDIVSYSKIIKDIERNINIYKSELEKME